MELEALMDKLALGKGKPGRVEQTKPKTEAKVPDDWQSDRAGSRDESESEEADDTQTQHKSYLHLLKGRKPPKGVPTKQEKLQIALREGRKQEKAMKLYYEEEQQMLRDKVWPSCHDSACGFFSVVCQLDDWLPIRCRA